MATAMKRRKKPIEDYWFAEGTLVRIVGERGTFVVQTSRPGKDNSILLYGGDADPNGHRCFRSVMPERLVIETRKHVIAKRKRQDAE